MPVVDDAAAAALADRPAPSTADHNAGPSPSHWTIDPRPTPPPAFPAPRLEQEIDLYLARQREFDADLWVIEVEDRAGGNFIEDYVLAD